MSFRKQQSGMTLPEVMVALLIFAAIATTSVYALRLGVDSRDQLSEADDELKRFQIARSLMKDDFIQISPRQIRDEFGIERSTEFVGNISRFGSRTEDDEVILAAFVRDGSINIQSAEPRSSLQYVEYVFHDRALIRRTRNYVDAAPNSVTNERVLFDGLETATAAYLTGEFRGELTWAELWPTSGIGGPPRAVSLTLEWPNKPILEQRFWIGTFGNSPRVGS